MRVEEISNLIFNDEIVKIFKKTFICMYLYSYSVIMHMVFIGYITKTLGFTWLALMIVCAELIIVITRFVFSYEQSFMGDLVRYWYAGLFLFASAYTLYEDGHVRVDVFYTNLKPKTKALINTLGSIFLGASTCLAIIFVGFNGKQAIINSPILNFEITQTVSIGMFIKYQMAAFLGIFAITMLIQFVSYYFVSLSDYMEKSQKFIKDLGNYGAIFFINININNGFCIRFWFSCCFCFTWCCNIIYFLGCNQWFVLKVILMLTSILVVLQNGYQQVSLI